MVRRRRADAAVWRLYGVLLVALVAGAASAQTAPPDSALTRAEAAFAAVTSDCPAPDARGGAVAALCDADGALCRGGFAPFAGDDSTFAVAGGVGEGRRLVALNRRDEDRFLALPAGAPPSPFVAVFASSGGVERVPGLVVSVGEADVLYGLRVPARTAVVFRSARPADVRPRGLDE